MVVAIEVTVPAAEVDLASGMLWEAGVTAIEERPAPGGAVVLVAGVAEDRDPEVVAGAVGGRWPTSVVEVGTGWRDAWRVHARPVRAGRRVVVVPVHPEAGREGATEVADLRPGDLVVEVDPGWAFGSGSHPSTRLALAALEVVVVDGASVLDVGCGSGVLSLVAARLGAARVVGVDPDPHARQATAANAARAGLDAVVAVSDRSVAEVEGAFDVVVANILPGVLVELAPQLQARLAPGGSLVLSGIPDDRAPSVEAAFATSVAARHHEAGWTALVLRR